MNCSESIMKFGKKVKDSIQKEFDSEPVYSEKINTNLHDSKILKERSQFISLSVILVDSVFRTVSGNNYYRQVFL